MKEGSRNTSDRNYGSFERIGAGGPLFIVSVAADKGIQIQTVLLGYVTNASHTVDPGLMQFHILEGRFRIERQFHVNYSNKNFEFSAKKN